MIKMSKCLRLSVTQIIQSGASFARVTTLKFTFYDCLSQEPSAAAGERAMIEPRGAIHFSLGAGSRSFNFNAPPLYIKGTATQLLALLRRSVIQVKYSMETCSVIELIKAGPKNTHQARQRARMKMQIGPINAHMQSISRLLWENYLASVLMNCAGAGWRRLLYQHCIQHVQCFIANKWKWDEQAPKNSRK